jgi:S-adenosylmethionine hydrolase
MTPTIALLTDFGTTDIYVGVMKGVIRKICAQADIIDISHTIQPQDICHGAFALLNAYRYFPTRTIFVAVVDPGVGSARRPVAVQAGDYTFVAPDNGVLSYLLADFSTFRVVELNNPSYHLPTVSNSFHGRDIFAPVAAHLAAGVNFDDLGTPIKDLASLPLPQLLIESDTITGEVLHIDHFGNVVTSIGALEWVSRQQLWLSPRFGDQPAVALKADFEVLLNDHVFDRLVATYGETTPGDWLTMVGSSGFLELAINQGNCAVRVGTVMGDPVKIRMK